METIKINLKDYIVECKIRKLKEAKGDIILLTGATTYSSTYFLFARYFKHFNLIIINTPGHGNTSGDAITVANYYLKFYEDTIKELIHQGYCNKKVNLVGYSLGGMALYHLLCRENLKEHINKSVFLFSAFRANEKAIKKYKNNYLQSKNSINPFLILQTKFIAPGPLYSKIIPSKFLFSSNSASLNDFILTESINKLSLDHYYKISPKDAIILATYDYFFLAGDILTTQEILSAKFLMQPNASHFSPLNKPSRYVKLIESSLLTT